MKYLIISFKSRDELFNFARTLKSKGIILSIINTPKGIASSCTLSIKTDLIKRNIVLSILKHFNPKSLLGLYSLTKTNNGEQVFKLA